MIKQVFTYIFLVVLTGCTSYGEMGFTGGVSSYKLSDNVYKVYARGNAFANKEKIEQFVLLKSAEIAKESGFDSFSFLDNKSGYNTTFSTSSTPGSFNMTSYGNSYNGTYTAPAVSTQQYNKPYSEALVTLHKGNGGMFKAETIIENFKYLKEDN